MLRQYRNLRAQVPEGTLLLFRLGDFYELFFEDAQLAAKVLNLTLTARNGMPMAGLPYHAAHSYIRRLLSAGYRVAIADQLEEPRPGHLVQRDIVQVISPGSVTDSASLDAGLANYIASVFCEEKLCGLALLDTSTGEFFLGEFAERSALLEYLDRVAPSELLRPRGHRLTSELQLASVAVSEHDGWTFRVEEGLHQLLQHYRTQSLDGFGCRELSVALAAAGGLWRYCMDVLRRDLRHVGPPKLIRPGEFMVLDTVTRHNLELVTSASGAPAKTHTLLGLLDETRTAMGARRLRQWILQPLIKSEAINQRQEAVAGFLSKDSILIEIRNVLGAIRDIERILGRITQGSGNARDLLALGQSLAVLPELIGKVEQLPQEAKLLFAKQINPMPELAELLLRAIREDCPTSMKEGGFIAEGYDKGLDELRAAALSGKDWIAQLQAKEAERTGIKSLKIRYNSVFGYYIEVTKANLSSVPADYQRKQTTANSERFITAELKEVENKILGSEERARKLEQEIFQELRQAVIAETTELIMLCEGLAVLDALASLAHVARLRRYTRPQIVTESILELKDAVHPILAALPSEERFVPNDVLLSGENCRLVIITGPNMAGKSTYLRMTALIALMAHVGSFVPAGSACIGVLDRIFTRIGASDDLARGQSTFMVEMNETANIMHHATERSLVILDEIGRGTATYDGLSIAWAVAEYLHNHVKCLTMFATHYHETTTLAAELPSARLMNAAVREWNDEIIFLRKILPGPADKSYGIQVARLAGLPKTVLSRAKELLAELEAHGPHVNDLTVHEIAKRKKAATKLQEQDASGTFLAAQRDGEEQLKLL